MPDTESLNPFIRAENMEGRKSEIYDYCKGKQDGAECIWICMKRGGRWIAKDIQLEESKPSIYIHELRRISSWWKQYSFYSAVGVKEVMIHFISYDQSKNEIGVVIIDFDYDGLQREIDECIRQIRGTVEIEHGECGVGILGKDDCASTNNEHCANTVFNDIDRPYCAAREIRHLARRGKNYRLLPSLLEHYWQEGIESKAIDFLRSSGFATKYKDLATDKYMDAANPYGKTIYGFMIIEGWHIKHMMLLFVAGLLCSICVTAIATAVGHSLEVGFTAGSYTLGIATVFLAVMTFLSAIL
ncbi:hypothetical protein BJX63DRAFT_92184 [Aspergillus granulosus]|uniref:Uncharacterized protein n=1 Tax=Aspergillus granulosus TaxID=176169 RepID=A0ABR4HSS3_9EURO